MRESDPMGEWGRSIKEIGLIEFQQRIGAKITPDDLVDKIELSQNPRSISQRKWRHKMKEKKDYEDLLKSLREQARQKWKTF